jgi:hypothetical protein
MKGTRKLWLLGALLLAVGGEARAIIGMPLTPFSFAGVARRSVRRSAYYGMAAAAPVVMAPPVGCMAGVPCAGRVYTPAYSAGNVVYVVR